MMEVFSLSISQVSDTSDDLSSSDDSDIEVTPTKNDDEDIQNWIEKMRTWPIKSTHKWC